MKHIPIVDGGPRRNMNTAVLCDAFAEGVRAASPEIEVERIRLYDSDADIPRKKHPPRRHRPRGTDPRI